MLSENVFKHPIEYSDNVKELNATTVADLELLQCNNNAKIDVDSCVEPEIPLHHRFYTTANNICKQMVVKATAPLYTTDIEYLKQTQTLTKTMQTNIHLFNTLNNKFNMDDFKMNRLVSLYDEIKGETGFCEKYQYIDWNFAKHLNNNSQFLQLAGLANIASPLISLCLPIVVLIVPFIIIKFTAVELNMTQYVNILKSLIKNNAIFKIFTEFNQVSANQKIYLLVSCAFYLFSIYQNILICIRFYSNMQKIYNYLKAFREYVSYTIRRIQLFLPLTHKLSKYTPFVADIQSQLLNFCIINGSLEQLDLDSKSVFTQTKQIGDVMQLFYQIYDSPVYENAIEFSFGFNGYICTLCDVVEHLQRKAISTATFKTKGQKGKKGKKSKKTKGVKPVFKQMYYPNFVFNTQERICNDCDLNTNMIITGPNASGKTTILKSALLNILLSQQIGFGCFESLELTPFDHIHCYLNIPDTSGRDSLFQAEARRCKEIIDCIDDNDNRGETHFCIFDELYSGTNPEEAVDSAHAFMEYIAKFNTVTFLLTTHYFKLCKQFVKHKTITNYHMKTSKTDTNTIQYNYELCKGISKIRGGLQILQEMKYPTEILIRCKRQ